MSAGSWSDWKVKGPGPATYSHLQRDSAELDDERDDCNTVPSSEKSVCPQKW